ncbi:MAG: hypothetical protein ACJ76P_04465 [Actinomycetota bacterium]
MAGAGAERPAIGLGIAAVENEGEDGAWAVDRRANGNWTEVERFGSETKARERLDEIAAQDGISLEDLRIRRIDD